MAVGTCIDRQPSLGLWPTNRSIKAVLTTATLRWGAWAVRHLVKIFMWLPHQYSSSGIDAAAQAKTEQSRTLATNQAGKIVK